VKKDPISYRDDFVTQQNCLVAELELLRLKPDKESDRLLELLEFVSQCVVCYDFDAPRHFAMLINVLDLHAEKLHPDVRYKLLQCCIMVKNHLTTDPMTLLKLSFRLLVLNDKSFRSLLVNFILNDIKNFEKTKGGAVAKRSLQSFIHKLILEESSLIAQKSVEIISDLYRKRIWADDKTVNILASACYNQHNKVMQTAVSFFLGIETIMAEDDEEETKKSKLDINLHEHSKKTRKRQRHVEKQKSKQAKRLRDSSTEKTLGRNMMPAIVVINDPHSLAEHLFKKVRQAGESFDQKLNLINFLSQLIGCHRLLILNFYSFLQKYMTAHQSNITNIMVYLVQGCHELVPPTELVPLVQSIAFNFISDRSGEESLALGLNTVREVFSRVPSILLEPDMEDLVQDLALYGHKNKKCVVSAARSLINLVRELHPQLLRKQDRGKGTDVSKKPLSYGENQVTSKIGFDDSEGDDAEIDEDDEEDSEFDEDDAEIDEDDEDQDMDEEEERSVCAEKENPNMRNTYTSRQKVSFSTEDVHLVRNEPSNEDQSDSSDSDIEDDKAHDYVVDASLLAPSGRIHKTTKIEKMKRILEGRNEVKFVHEGHAGGLTNKEKLRKKNFVMVRRGKRSVLMKTRRSQSDLRAAKNSRVCQTLNATFLIILISQLYSAKYMGETRGKGGELEIKDLSKLFVNIGLNYSLQNLYEIKIFIDCLMLRMILHLPYFS
jgi:protein SDA1